jgi:hypothetical protein
VITKEAAFQRDQQLVAQNFACVLGFTTAAPTKELRAAFMEKVSKRVKSKRDTVGQMIDLFPVPPGNRPLRLLGPWQHCADWLIQSLAKTTAVKDHLFLTAFIPETKMAAQLQGGGLRVKACAFSLPQSWTQLDPAWKSTGTCPFVNQQLPSITVKPESDKTGRAKGLGLFSAQKIRAKDLVVIYLGEFEENGDVRPGSRMVIHQTSTHQGRSWGYCYGIESLSECLKVGPALGPYANAPSNGETCNCFLDRDQSFNCIDESGKKMIGFPVFALHDICENVPLLWDYSPNAARGRNFVS